MLTKSEENKIFLFRWRMLPSQREVTESTRILRLVNLVLRRWGDRQKLLQRCKFKACTAK